MDRHQIDLYMNFNHPLKTYSCRFELPQDLTQFILLSFSMNVRVYAHLVRQVPLVHPDGQVTTTPDIEVEFTSPAPIEKIRSVLKNGVDLHVGLQTLRECPLEQNSLERDYDLV